MKLGFGDAFRFEEYTGLSVGRTLLLAIPVVALIAGSIWLAVQFLDPMPPRRIVLAAGPEGSALHALGVRYAKSLTAKGIGVDVRVTRGAGDNLDLLADGTETVTLGFLVAGTAAPEQAKRLVNLSNLFHVPLWCVTRSTSPEVTIAELRGKRIAVGAPGTGLAAALAPLLAVNDVTPSNTTLLHLPAADVVRALASGEIDASFLTDSAGGADFDEVAAIPGVHLVSFPRAAAYARRYSHLVHLDLPRGTLDLARDIPDRDLSLIGTSMMIAAHPNVHPTVVDLVVDAARELQGGQNVFDRRGEFPHLAPVDDVPVSSQALLYAREGPSLLRQYLPLWVADAVQRAIFLAIPLAAVLVPLMRVLPGLLELLSRRYLFRGYLGLRRVERTMRTRPMDASVDDLLRELDRIEESMADIRESVVKAGELYSFRVHLRVVRDAVRARALTARTAAPVVTEG